MKADLSYSCLIIHLFSKYLFSSTLGTGFWGFSINDTDKILVLLECTPEARRRVGRWRDNTGTSECYKERQEERREVLI